MITIYVDLDGTLAKYDGYKGVGKIGKPIPQMVDVVKKHLSQGHKVKIFTARIENEEERPHIEKWLKDAGIPDLEITNIKGNDGTVFYDDRAIQVKKNEGILVDDVNDLLSEKAKKRSTIAGN